MKDRNNNLLKIDYNFFKKINSNEKAYVLGLVISDGSISTNKKLSFCVKDYDMVLNIKKLLKSEHKISHRSYFDKRTQKTYSGYSYQISSKKIVNDLKKIGIKEKKSFDCDFPKIKKTYYSHLIRGIFDGDGSIGCLNKVNNNNKRIFRFSVCGTNNIIDNIQNILIKNCDVSVVNQVILASDKNNKSVVRINYGGKFVIKNILDYLYKDSTKNTRILRKYSKYLELIDETKKKPCYYNRGCVEQFDIKNNLIKEWENAGIASKTLNINCGSIYNTLNNKKNTKSAGGFIWKYKPVLKEGI